MQKERIREQLGYFEEQMERLDAMERPNDDLRLNGAYDFDEKILLNSINQSFDELQVLVEEETLKQKSVSANDFISRVVRCLIAQANEFGFDLAVTQYGEGRVSLEMVELSMSAILSCIKASLRSFIGMSRGIRAKNHLFLPYSIHLEIKAGLDEIYFKLMDDGAGYGTDFTKGCIRYFEGIRTEVARNGGWFRYRSFEVFGGMIEFKMPVKKARFEAAIIRTEDGEIVIPTHCIADVKSPDLVAKDQDVKFFAKGSVSRGLELCSREDFAKFNSALLIGVADFHFWLACECLEKRLRVRRYSAEGFLEDNSWFTNFGIFYENNLGKTLPLIDGEVLLRFYGEAPK